MARVLICDPHADISALLELVVRRLGHDPVAYGGAELDHTGVDAAVIEPGVEAGMRLARRLRAQNVPVLFTSIYPAEAEMLELSPAAYLVKPFPLYELERALCSALEARSAPAEAPATGTASHFPSTI
jgi:DNA-binding response OmpR family regulator